jgi:hypothetical protein
MYQNYHNYIHGNFVRIPSLHLARLNPLNNEHSDTQFKKFESMCLFFYQGIYFGLDKVRLIDCNLRVCIYSRTPPR